MKLPKQTNRYCPYCKKHTAQIISIAKQKSRSTTHPLSRGSPYRVKARGLRSGTGNKGRYSKPAVKSWKRKSKITKRMTIIYTCKECKKAKGISKSVRTSKIEIGQALAK
ncbi:MAG: 50S ribosomal protein L44e [Nanoarchaeota archaeon]